MSNGLINEFDFNSKREKLELFNSIGDGEKYTILSITIKVLGQRNIPFQNNYQLS